MRLEMPYDPLFDISADGVTGGTDGAIDINDLDYLVRFLVDTSVGTGSECGDFNLDGLIDTTDLTRLATFFGFDASADAIPEPATMGLLVLGGLAVLRRRQ